MSRKRSPRRRLLDTSAVVYHLHGHTLQQGDTIIALQVHRGVAVVTADRTFVSLGELLGRTVVLLPSLAELKRRTADSSE